VLNLSNLFGTSSKTVAYKAGDTVFQAGDVGKELYVVIEGQVDIVAGGRVVESVIPGGMFGEMALIDSSPRSASAVAAVDSTLAPVDERRFTFLVQETPFFALHVMQVMAQRLRRNNG
jgi:CRP/FNR family transcriptional regulator, cyclic AMP receptor protein